jgi:hypothetical protein
MVDFAPILPDTQDFVARDQHTANGHVLMFTCARRGAKRLTHESFVIHDEEA